MACTYAFEPVIEYTQDDVLERMDETINSHHVINLDSDAFMEGGGGTEVKGVQDGSQSTILHASGWYITGTATWDHYCFCTTFRASHVIFGDVWSPDLNDDTESCINATSAAAMEHFWNHHGDCFSTIDLCDI